MKGSKGVSAIYEALYNDNAEALYDPRHQAALKYLSSNPPLLEHLLEMALFHDATKCHSVLERFNILPMSFIRKLSFCVAVNDKKGIQKTLEDFETKKGKCLFASIRELPGACRFLLEHVAGFDIPNNDIAKRKVGKMRFLFDSIDAVAQKISLIEIPYAHEFQLSLRKMPVLSPEQYYEVVTNSNSVLSTQRLIVQALINLKPEDNAKLWSMVFDNKARWRTSRYADGSMYLSANEESYDLEKELRKIVFNCSQNNECEIYNDVADNYITVSNHLKCDFSEISENVYLMYAMSNKPSKYVEFWDAFNALPKKSKIDILGKAIELLTTTRMVVKMESSFALIEGVSKIDICPAVEKHLEQMRVLIRLKNKQPNNVEKKSIKRYFEIKRLLTQVEPYKPTMLTGINKKLKSSQERVEALFLVKESPTIDLFNKGLMIDLPAVMWILEEKHTIHELLAIAKESSDHKIMYDLQAELARRM